MRQAVVRRAWLSLVAIALGLATASPAGADTASFTSAGCSVWTVPAGVDSVGVLAVGDAGSMQGGGPSAGARGDGISATLTILTPGQMLHVCVNVGGGRGGFAFGVPLPG